MHRWGNRFKHERSQKIYKQKFKKVLTFENIYDIIPNHRSEGELFRETAAGQETD